ncbi:hypothetical protein CYMTET_49105 [Cymbomonas tetramitiformis]|uniref:Uncharacterized protein n=1 Tax=Cymbomonas tetramitiformis TaxID=36881 RepID=A0AAE0BSK3_9CHLO|nr:hypothetical protein CYMTET_49105 [Cymbomonas tetramitiformis]
MAAAIVSITDYVSTSSILAVHTVLVFWSLLDNHLTEGWVLSNVFVLYLLIYVACKEASVRAIAYLFYLYQWSMFGDAFCLFAYGDVNTVDHVERFSLLCSIFLFLLKFPFALHLRSELAQLRGLDRRFESIPTVDPDEGPQGIYRRGQVQEPKFQDLYQAGGPQQKPGVFESTLISDDYDDDFDNMDCDAAIDSSLAASAA